MTLTSHCNGTGTGYSQNKIKTHLDKQYHMDPWSNLKISQITVDVIYDLHPFYC